MSTSHVSQDAIGSVPLPLYADLLKKVLTNTVHAPEPSVSQDNEFAFFHQFQEHYINGPAISMMPMARMDNLQNCILDVVRQNIPGDFIETGVWRGGATIFMRSMLKALGVTDRLVWVADSFEGLPEPDAERHPKEAKAHAGRMMRTAYRHFAAGLDEVQANFRAFGVLDEQVRFLKGWFKDTLPTAPIGKLAIMRLDGDYHDSTMDSLVNLYDHLSVGGYVIIDDYGEDRWTYCRQAVETFREQRGISHPITRVDEKCSFWRRTD